jgi:hypothetical protein
MIPLSNIFLEPRNPLSVLVPDLQIRRTSEQQIKRLLRALPRRNVDTHEARRVDKFSGADEMGGSALNLLDAVGC